VLDALKNYDSWLVLQENCDGALKMADIRMINLKFKLHSLGEG